MGKALHPKVCGCGSTSFTKEKQGKPWYCESCELGFCTKCGEWPLLTGSDKSCGVCIAQQAYPDCTGCFVYDEITNVSLLQHHGNTCPVHEDKPEPTGEVLVCDEGCGGTGQFITKIVNGTPQGPGGIHFRCQGKGKQTDADRIRNYWYDVKFRKVYI